MSTSHRTGPRTNYLGGRMPLTVFVAGTRRKTKREIEGEGRCKYCREKKKTLYSYEDSGEPFCNRSCWTTWMFEGRQTKRFLREIDELAQEESERKNQAKNVVSITSRSKATKRQATRAGAQSRGA